ncbi:hypothetical protein L917_05436 [Phytophthora nicotianae]|uniref:Uncharacterized protein n=1 Tax=Phytophthora nicotianae TaxID=4792 RepID=W2H678_PHYNI|nr:hypothetical protein L915_05608 [Phytophthora nicotianae]ETL97249.1 hypothetical protein L917_05436 [Phytophthora nicotianae]
MFSGAIDLLEAPCDYNLHNFYGFDTDEPDPVRLCALALCDVLSFVRSSSKHGENGVLLYWAFLKWLERQLSS